LSASEIGDTGGAGSVSSFVAPIRRIDTAKGHYYKDAAGTRVPGVTTFTDGGLPKKALIEWAGNATAEYAVDHWDELGELKPAARLNKLKRARYEARDAAAKRGTEVHRAAEKLLAGQPAQVPEELAGHVESYARFLDEFSVEPVHVEFSCVSYKWGYAGTADLCAWLQIPRFGRVLTLDDCKTSRSGIYGETALQLAGYRYADVWLIDGKEVTPDPVEHCYGIHVRADGYDLLPLEVDEREFKDFLYAARIKGFVDRASDLVGAPVMPPTTSTFRLIREQQ
jgi:hypothetical protein